MSSITSRATHPPISRAIRSGLRGPSATGLRAFFNDSYEVDDATGQADATPAFFEAFRERRGYDLREHLPALAGTEPRRRANRVLADYRLTMSDLLLETFTTEWNTWAHGRGAVTRNQAHGSPANLLDLYAASDIPETEGTEIARSKWAASAGHVAGRPLIAAEAATWLGEHFRSTLADVRATLDRFYRRGRQSHGLSRHRGLAGARALAGMAVLCVGRIQRSESVVARSAGAQSVRDARPVVPAIRCAGSRRAALLPVLRLRRHSGHRASRALWRRGCARTRSAFEAARDLMQRRGFTYDFVSDRQLRDVRVEGATLVTGGGTRYSAIVLPASRYIPLETFAHVLALANQGARVIAFGGFAADVAGPGGSVEPPRPVPSC